VDIRKSRALVDWSRVEADCQGLLVSRWFWGGGMVCALLWGLLLGQACP